MKCLVGIFLFAFGYGAVTAENEESSTLHGKIIHGKPVNITEVPYEVQLERDGRFLCGGSIISKTFILTAAHCVDKINMKCHNVTIRTGSHFKGTGGKVFYVEEIIQHPNYTDESGDYDVALVRLSKPICYHEKSKAIALIDVEQSIEKNLQVSGWGMTDSKDTCSGAKTLQAVSVPLMDWKICEQKVIDFKKFSSNDCPEISVPDLTPRMFCTDATKGGACHGDSGSPVTNFNGTQVGIVSWALYGKSKTEFDYCVSPNVFVDLSNREINEFIRENANI